MDKRSRGPVPLGDAIQAFLRESGIRAGGQSGDVFRAWKQALGTQHAEEARPVAFRNRALHVEVTSTSLLQDLKSYSGDRFRRKANEILGDDRIKKIVVKLTSR